MWLALPGQHEVSAFDALGPLADGHVAAALKNQVELVLPGMGVQLVEPLRGRMGRSSDRDHGQVEVDDW